MSQIGGELNQLRQLKSTFDRQAATIQELMSTIRNQLNNTTWSGPAADRFRSAWQGEYEPSLRKLDESLREAGMEVGRRTDALEQAGS